MVVEVEGSGSHCECTYEAERGEITSQITVCLIQPGVPPSSPHLWGRPCLLSRPLLICPIDTPSPCLCFYFFYWYRKQTGRATWRFMNWDCSSSSGSTFPFLTSTSLFVHAHSSQWEITFPLTLNALQVFLNPEACGEKLVSHSQKSLAL